MVFIDIYYMSWFPHVLDHSTDKDSTKHSWIGDISFSFHLSIQPSIWSSDTLLNTHSIPGTGSWQNLSLELVCGFQRSMLFSALMGKDLFLSCRSILSCPSQQFQCFSSCYLIGKFSNAYQDFAFVHWTHSSLVLSFLFLFLFTQAPRLFLHYMFFNSHLEILLKGSRVPINWIQLQKSS